MPTLILLASNQLYCTTDLAGMLSANPAGGIWSGPGVIANLFDPSIAGFGLHNISYFYTDANSCTNSDTLLMTVKVCVGINEISDGSLFSVYPNPATNEIIVKAVPSLLGSVYVVYDNIGKIALKGKITSENTVIELGNLSVGIYLLNIGGNLKQTFKIIKE